MENVKLDVLCTAPYPPAEGQIEVEFTPYI